LEASSASLKLGGGPVTLAKKKGAASDTKFFLKGGQPGPVRSLPAGNTPSAPVGPGEAVSA
jgi:hypothetical protein